MPPKKQFIGELWERSTSTKRVRLHRERETEANRERRLANQRVRQSQLRASQTPEQRAEQNRIRRLRYSQATTSHRRQGLYMEGFSYNIEKDYCLHPKVTIGEMDIVCEYCQATKFKFQSRGMCCSDSKVKLTPLSHPPETLLSLISGANPRSTHFLQNIRKYNSCFQMTSFGTTAFKIRGQICHRIGSLMPLLDESHKFLQMYFFGNEDEEATLRCDTIPGTKKEIVLDIQKILHAHNALVKMFKTALKRMPTDQYELIIRADKTPVNEHDRKFNF